MAQQIEGVVEESSETSNAAADAGLRKWKAGMGSSGFLLARFIKNLGQLLEQSCGNESQIRKSTRAMAGVDAEEQANYRSAIVDAYAGA